MIPLFLSLIALLLVVILYHNKPGQLLIRLLVIIVAYALLTNLVLKIRKSPSPPVLLVDWSPSLERFYPVIDSMIDALNFKYRKIYFSDTIFTDGTRGKGRFTNITEALLEARMQSPSLILLISDGNHNFGVPPAEILNDFEIPVFCFGIGSKEIRDQKIVNVFYPDYAFVGDTVLIEVEVATNGFDSSKGMILLKGDKLSIEKNLKLSRSLALQTVQFKFVPTGYGEKNYKILLPPQEYEVSLANNESTISIKIIERKISILYYTDYPSFNTMFIKNSLKNPDLEVSWFIRLSEKHYETGGRIQSDFQKFDIIILDNISAETINQDIKRFLEMGKSILLIGAVRGTSALANEMLPFRTGGVEMEEQLSVKILRPFPGLYINRDYAPISRINRIIGTNPQSTIIAQAGDLPLIGYCRVNKGIVFQINIPDLGQWHFAQLNLNNQDVLNPLLDQIIRFLSPYGKSNRLILHSPVYQYQLGDKVTIFLKAYDQRLMPVSGGEFYLDVNKRRLPFFETKRGNYEVSFFPEAPGELLVSAQGIVQNDTLKSYPLKIFVKAVERESEEIINDHLLNEIGSKTGGGYFDFAQLIDFTPPASLTSHTTKTLSFDHPLSYLVIFCLLVLDWIIRKKRGQL